MKLRLHTWTLAMVVTLMAMAPAWAGETIARCGQGYLESVDGGLVLHIKGTPYEMGYQHGALLKKHCKEAIHYLFDVKAKDMKLEAFGMTLTARQIIANIVKIQKPHIPVRFIEELEGLADGVGLPLEDIMLANFIPELFHCSGFALLNEKTADGTLLHGRVLDYGVDWKLQDHAIVMIAEPEGKIPFVNVTYAGFIGSVSGMNRQQVSVGEMGGRGLGKWNGTPMAFLVRRVLEEARTLDEAIAIFRDSKRTCEYYYVVADAKANNAVGMEASADKFFTVKPGEAHAQLPTPVPNAVLLSAGDRYKCLCELVQKVHDNKGKFTIDQAIHLMDKPVAMTSNLHNVLFAGGLGKLWVANAGPNAEPAWTQKYREYDFARLLTQQTPSGGNEIPMQPKRVGKPIAVTATPTP